MRLFSHSSKHSFARFLEHVAIGAGVYATVSGTAGWKPVPGLLGAGLIAGFKESSDAIAKRDTKKQAAFHAVSILIGAGITAAIKHK